MASKETSFSKRRSVGPRTSEQPVHYGVGRGHPSLDKDDKVQLVKGKGRPL